MGTWAVHVDNHLAAAKAFMRNLSNCKLHLAIIHADVGNAFATSVGSRTLKLKWALVIAGVMETLGAIFLGGSVSSTISGGNA